MCGTTSVVVSEINKIQGWEQKTLKINYLETLTKLYGSENKIKANLKNKNSS